MVCHMPSSGARPRAPYSAPGAAASPSEGCSKPQSWMARSSSGLRRKSLKPEEWMPTYPFFTASPLAPSAASGTSSSS